MRSRKVVAWPDVDGFQEWTDKLSQFSSCPSVTPGLTGSLTIPPANRHPERPRCPHRHRRLAHPLAPPPNPRADATFAAVAQYFAPEVHSEIQALIRELDLEFVGMEQIEEENNSEKTEKNTAS